MTEYIYRVVSRSPGGEWEQVETGKRLYFTIGPARGARSMKRQEHEWQEESRRRYVERFGVSKPEIVDAFAPNPREFAVARVPVGEWEVITDDE